MKTINITTIAVLPIGEFDADPIKNKIDAIIGAFNRSKTNLVVSDPVSDEEEAR
jgi:hypothetical protein